MSVTSLRAIYRPTALPAADIGAHADAFGMALVRAGYISAGDLLAAMARGRGHLAARLLGAEVIDEETLYRAMAAHFALGLADFARYPLDMDLLAQVDAAQCLAAAWVPWRKMGRQVIIAAAHPQDFDDLRRTLAPRFGDIICVLAPRRAIEAQIMGRAGGALARRAETLLPSADSCRNFTPRSLYMAVTGLGMALAVGILLAPIVVYLALIAAALALAFGQTALRIAAMAALLRAPSALGQPITPAPPAPQHLQLIPAAGPLPMISIMVPLFGESRIIARLIRRLDRLNYPRARLEVIFLLEDTDAATARALAGINLPPMMRTLTVPSGTIRTKPRALNYGLSHCAGDIIGVYDAEDAPDPDQLRAVAQGFAGGGENLACLQGRLDYYNPRINWLSRCFTIEYAAWWRVILPGFARMGFALPLGGTTLFFRRTALQDLGGWDAHNVTEDAELGMRLARRGYSTQLLDSTTHEEANCRPLPWVKQRSRWIKGYMMTWMTLMRAPRALLRDLGAWRFFGFQMMFAGSVVQALLAPLLWTLWLVPLGVFDAAFANVPQVLLIFVLAACVASEGVQIAVNAWGLRKAGHKISFAWLPLMLPYHLMASAAAYKAAYEVLTRPFYWDKTTHGLFDP